MVIVLIQITYQLTYYFYQGVSLVEPKLASNHGFNYSRNNYF